MFWAKPDQHLLFSSFYTNLVILKIQNMNVFIAWLKKFHVPFVD